MIFVEGAKNGKPLAADSRPRVADGLVEASLIARVVGRKAGIEARLARQHIGHEADALLELRMYRIVEPDGNGAEPWMVLVQIAVLRKPVADHRVIEKLPVAQDRRHIRIAGDQHNRVAQARQDRGLEFRQVIGLHMHHRPGRERRRQPRHEGQRNLRPQRVLDIALEIDHHIRALADRFRVHMMKRQSGRTMAGNAPQLRGRAQTGGPAAA